MKTIALIGKNISYSFSKKYFTQKFKQENIENIKYENIDIENIEEIKKFFENPNNIGYNVTIPYKEKIIPFLQKLDYHAQKIGAVNTIAKKNGKLIGYNTDWIGFTKSLTPILKNKKHKIKKALILGTGGASKAIIYALKNLNIEYIQVSRTPKKHQLSYEELNTEIIQNHQLIINCSPVGTHPNIENCPKIPYNALSNHHILYDLIYNPEQTLFLKKAIEQGASIINGYPMLIYQAEEAWKIWKNNDY